MLLFEVERYYSGNNVQPYLECLYKALFILAYYGMMRVGELTLSPHTLKACDIHIGNNKDKILIVLYSSKTHGKESRPQHIKVSAIPMRKKDKKFFCPFKIVLKYMKVRGSYKDENKPFFMFSDSSPVKGQHMRSVLRTLLTRIHLDGDLYDVHSFRSGRTIDLEKFGYNLDQIKSMGRWRSNAVYRYLKN